MTERKPIVISRRAVDRLRPAGADAIFWDRDLPGFGVRVYPSGRKVYVVQARAGGGGPRRATLGAHGELTPERARKRAASVIARIKAGGDPAAAPPDGGTTVADLAERYMKVHVAANCNAHTARIYRGSLDNHILPALGAMPLASVGRAEVAALHRRLRATPRAANRALAILAKMFSLAEQWGAMPEGGNPCRAVRKYRENRRARFLTREEYRRLGAALAEAEAGRLGVAPRGGRAAPADADRLPAERDPDAALGRRRPPGRGVPAARRQDRGADGAADPDRPGGARRDRARPGQPVGDRRAEAGKPARPASPPSGTASARAPGSTTCGSTICGTHTPPARCRPGRACR